MFEHEIKVFYPTTMYLIFIQETNQFHL